MPRAGRCAGMVGIRHGRPAWMGWLAVEVCREDPLQQRADLGDDPVRGRARQVYGGLVVVPTGPTMLAASAASPAVAAALTSLAQSLGRAPGVTVVTKDVVPLPTEDPRGAGLATVLLPVLVGAVAPVLLMARAARRVTVRIGGVLTSNLVTGFSVVAVLHFGLGTFVGSYVLESLTLTLTLAAISMGAARALWRGALDRHRPRRADNAPARHAARGRPNGSRVPPLGLGATRSAPSAWCRRQRSALVRLLRWEPGRRVPRRPRLLGRAGIAPRGRDGTPGGRGWPHGIRGGSSDG